MPKPVPILYYHSIADHDVPRVWSFLSCPIRIFEKQMAYLARNGWYTCHWHELEDHLNGKKALPDKTVMLHFDDGFLDNWTVAHPIMEQYGIKYSVLLTVDFIQQKPGIVLRKPTPQTRNVDSKRWWGYLSEREIKTMADSGLADFQAHGYSHTWFPVSDEIVDVYDGTQVLPHLRWNVLPEEKPFWLHSYPAGLVEGYPVFKFEKSLANERAFIFDPRFISASVQAYDPALSKAENLSRTRELARQYKAEGKLGRYEDDRARDQRLEGELKWARKFIEHTTGKPVHYLVYPGGGHTERVDRLAFEYGYRLLSKGTRPNAFGSGLKYVQRFTAYSPFKPRRFSLLFNMLLFRFQLARGQGNKLVHGLINFAKRILR